MKLSTFGRDPKKSLGGVWWDFEAQERIEAPHATHLCLLIAEWDNPKYRDSLARQRVARFPELKAGGEQAKKATEEIGDRAVAEAVLLNWANCDAEDGKPQDYTADLGYAALQDPANWPFRQFVLDVSGITPLYRRAAEEAAKGN